MVVLVSRNAIDPVCWLMELGCEYNSERCSQAIQIYLYHHLGGWGAVFKVLSSTYSITKFAKISLTGEPIAQPNICL